MYQKSLHPRSHITPALVRGFHWDFSWKKNVGRKKYSLLPSFTSTRLCTTLFALEFIFLYSCATVFWNKFSFCEWTRSVEKETRLNLSKSERTPLTLSYLLQHSEQTDPLAYRSCSRSLCRGFLSIWEKGFFVFQKKYIFSRASVA